MLALELLDLFLKVGLVLRAQVRLRALGHEVGQLVEVQVCLGQYSTVNKSVNK